MRSDPDATASLTFNAADENTLKRLLKANLPPCQIVRRRDDLEAHWTFATSLGSQAEPAGRRLQARYGGVWSPGFKAARPPEGGAVSVFERPHSYALTDVLEADDRAAEERTKRVKYDIPKLKGAYSLRTLVEETHVINREGKVLCPFHEDRNPNCHIYKEQYYCFSCQAKGDHIDWLGQVHRLDKATAIQALARRANGSTPEARRRPSAEEREGGKDDDKGSRKAYIAKMLKCTVTLPKSGSAPYLLNKGLPDDGETYYGEDKRGVYAAKLIVDIKGTARGIQKLYEDEKRFVWGSKTGGNFIRVGILNPRVIFIGEGYATVRSAEWATQIGGAAALSVNNLLKVGKVLKGEHPEARLVFLAEDGLRSADEPGEEAAIGLTSAKEAAAACGGSYVLPNFSSVELARWAGKPPSDFDDLRQLAGLGEVKRQLAPFCVA